ncbi:MAG: PIG-L family deacetylase [Bacillota bacterium]|nr:PIG-L family deacetylase [Bacillota bacterium]
MDLINTGSEIFIPDNIPLEKALKRTTHLAISAHQDDIEIMAYDGIAKCFCDNSNWFSGIVVTNGTGSTKNGFYKTLTDEEFISIRKKEQKKAAYLGEYSSVALLNYSSAEAKDPHDKFIIDDLKKLISQMAPQIIYTHNLFDRHSTHVGVAVKVINALRALPEEQRPKKVFGCEIWRSLDWLTSSDKVDFDASRHPNIASALVGLYDSQISGNKQYDRATIGRRYANATFSASHSPDASNSSILGMDLTPLINNTELNIIEYVQGYIDRFNEDIINGIKSVL